jgi:hypothetical protein
VSSTVKLTSGAINALSLDGKDGVYIGDNGSSVLRIHEYGTDDLIAGQTTNNDLFLSPNGAGVLKFGTYSAGVAGNSTGYIPIKDAGGATRKLMVQA